MTTVTGANGQQVEHLTINGKLVEVDAEIAPIVRALNDGGAETIASCYGHGILPPVISLECDQHIVIARSFEELERILALFRTDICGRSKAKQEDDR